MRQYVLLFILLVCTRWGQADPWDKAAQVPADRTAVVAWDTEGQVDLLPLWKLAVKIDHDSLPEEQLHWDMMLAHLGLDLEEWLAHFDGSGFWAYSPSADSHEFHFRLSPSSNLPKRLAEKFGGGDKPFRKTTGDGGELRCDDTQFSICLGPASGDRATLAGDSRFLDARRRLGSTPCDLLLFLRQEGSDTEYAALSVDFSEKSAVGFWKLDQAKDLPVPEGFDLQLLTSRPAGLATLVAVDLKWLDSALDRLRTSLPPKLETMAKFLEARRAPGGLFQTFSGRGLLATDQTPAAFLIGQAPSVSLYAVGQFQELSRVEKFLHDLEYETRLQTLEGCEKNLERLAWEIARWEVDFKREIPADLNELVPELLSELPDCPSAGRSTYVAVKTEAEGRTVYCRGHHHPQTQPDFPRFTQRQGAQRGDFRPPADLPNFSRADADGRAAYRFSSGQRISVDIEQKLVYLADGSKDESFLTVPAPFNPLSELAQENFQWGGDHLIYLDYFQLSSDLPRLRAQTQDEYPDTGELLIQAFLETVRQSETTEASNAFRRDPDGISYRGTGLWGSSVLTTPVAALSLWVQAAVRREETVKAVACRDNILRLAQAVENYANDHEGAFPERLADLVPEYLSKIPHCPNAAADTYSESFISDRHVGYDPSSSYFIVRCLGHHHRGARWKENQPAYQTGVGVVPQPEQ